MTLEQIANEQLCGPIAMALTPLKAVCAPLVSQMVTCMDTVACPPSDGGVDGGVDAYTLFSSVFLTSSCAATYRQAGACLSPSCQERCARTAGLSCQPTNCVQLCELLDDRTNNACFSARLAWSDCAHFDGGATCTTNGLEFSHCQAYRSTLDGCLADAGISLDPDAGSPVDGGTADAGQPPGISFCAAFGSALTVNAFPSGSMPKLDVALTAGGHALAVASGLGGTYSLAVLPDGGSIRNTTTTEYSDLATWAAGTQGASFFYQATETNLASRRYTEGSGWSMTLDDAGTGAPLDLRQTTFLSPLGDRGLALNDPLSSDGVVLATALAGLSFDRSPLTTAADGGARARVVAASATEGTAVVAISLANLTANTDDYELQVMRIDGGFSSSLMPGVGRLWASNLTVAADGTAHFLVARDSMDGGHEFFSYDHGGVTWTGPTPLGQRGQPFGIVAQPGGGAVVGWVSGFGSTAPTGVRLARFSPGSGWGAAATVAPLYSAYRDGPPTLLGLADGRLALASVEDGELIVRELSPALTVGATLVGPTIGSTFAYFAVSSGAVAVAYRQQGGDSVFLRVCR